MMFWTDHAVSGWGWALMAISMVLFWGLVVAVGVLLFRGVDQPKARSSGGPRPSPEQLLAERFARGEIDEEEYRRRMTTLTASRPGGP